MATGTTPLIALHPAGFPRAFVAGRAVVLGFFITPLTATLGTKKNPIRIEDEVVAKERPRARVMSAPGKRPFPQLYTPEKTAAWEAHVAADALEQLRSVEVDGDEDFTLPIKDCRILMDIRFNLRKPPSYPKSMVHAVKKPDLDNLVKAILDGMVQGRIIEDDNCITDLQTRKRYADAEHPPGVEVELTCLPL